MQQQVTDSKDAQALKLPGKAGADAFEDGDGLIWVRDCSGHC